MGRKHGKNSSKKEKKVDNQEVKCKESDKRKHSDMDSSGLTPDEKKLNRRLSQEYHSENESMEGDGAERVVISSDRQDESELDDLRIKNFESKLSCLIDTVDFIATSMKEVTEELKKVKKELCQFSALKQEMKEIKAENRYLKQRINDQENYSRRDNLEIAGVPETQGESCEQLCMKIFQEMGISHPVPMVRCHRNGKPKENFTRPILIRLRNYSDREEIMKKKSNLKGRNIYINEDLCLDSKRRRDNLVPLLKELKKTDPKTSFRGDKILHKGRLYDEAAVKDMPIDTHGACTKSDNNVTLFAGKFSKLSNLHPCQIEVDGQQWNSVEHFIQYQKAKAAEQHDMAIRIRNAEDATEALQLGKKVPANTQWDNQAEALMEKALIVKFKIPQFNNALRKTESIIGEGTRHPIWGIGHSINHKGAFNTANWTGRNIMGKLLTKIKSQCCK